MSVYTIIILLSGSKYLDIYVVLVYQNFRIIPITMPVCLYTRDVKGFAKAN